MKLGRMLVAAATAAACLAAAAQAQAGVPTVVSLGDSAISGEAGRWAGNTNGASWRTDATGPATYYDNAAGTGAAVRLSGLDLHGEPNMTLAGFAAG